MYSEINICQTWGGKIADYLLYSLTQNIREAVLLANTFNKIYKTSIVKGNSIEFDTLLSYAEDYLFNLRFIKHASTIAFISDHLYYYDHSTENSLSKRVMPYFFDISIYLNNTLHHLFPDKNDEELYYKNIRHIQHNTLAIYARRKGLKGFIQQVKKIFTNEELKLASATKHCKNIGLQELFPVYAVRHKLFILYLIWCYVINIIPFAKHYIERMIK